MKQKCLAFFLVLSLFLGCVEAYAVEVDLAKLSAEELLELRDAINLTLLQYNDWDGIEDAEAVKLYEMALQGMELAESNSGYSGFLRAYKIAMHLDGARRFECIPDIAHNECGYTSTWTLLDDENKQVQFIVSVQEDEEGRVWRDEVLLYQLRTVYKAGQKAELYDFETAEAMTYGFDDVGSKQIKGLLIANSIHTGQNTTLFSASIDGDYKPLYITYEIKAMETDEDVLLESLITFDGGIE